MGSKVTYVRIAEASWDTPKNGWINVPMGGGSRFVPPVRFTAIGRKCGTESLR
jgi:hypothetical protein